MRKIIRVIFEVIIASSITYFLWDKSIPAMDNIAMMIPLYFIYGLMYLILR